MPSVAWVIVIIDIGNRDIDQQKEVTYLTSVLSFIVCISIEIIVPLFYVLCPFSMQAYVVTTFNVGDDCKPVHLIRFI